MISESDLKEIEPPRSQAAASSGHVHSGLPIPKAARIRTFSADDWEGFVEEWATTLAGRYAKVRRFGGSGDKGVDVACFHTTDGFFGAWDNYQCKHYGHPLRPSDIWVEIGKVIYYSFSGEYQPPESYYFIAPHDIGTSLGQTLSNHPKLKKDAESNWDQYCRHGITKTTEVALTGDLLQYFEAFDFTIFTSKSHVDLIEDHSKTQFHAVRFGGGLPLRPDTESPPSTPTTTESRYVRQLLDAYSDHIGEELDSPDSLRAHAKLERDYLRQRERFYHAESLRNFARDTVPHGTFESLQEDVYQGVVDTTEGGFADGFERMSTTVQQAAQVQTGSNALASVIRTQDRQGICHQLANEDKLIWVPDNE